MSDVCVDLNGKVAFITGSGNGIGRGFALQMARDGAAVMVTDIDEPAAAEVAAEIEGLGGQAVSRRVDVTDMAAVEAAVAETIDRFGRLDFLFANAGILGPAAFEETTPDVWDLMLDVNVKGVVYACRAVVPHMMARRQGRILITASFNGLRPGAHVIPYRVTKAGIIMYTRCLAQLMAPYNVTVNAICPGITLTPLQLEYSDRAAEKRGISLDEYLADRAARIPMQQVTEIEDVSALAEFLVSDSARLITGQAIGPDGGIMAS